MTSEPTQSDLLFILAMTIAFGFAGVIGAIGGSTVTALLPLIGMGISLITVIGINIVIGDREASLS